MRKVLQKKLIKFSSLNEINIELIKFLENLKFAGQLEKIGYVSGILASEGPQSIIKNRRKLANYTKQIKVQSKFPVFSTADVFTNKVYTNLEEMRLDFDEREYRFRDFWVKIINSGHITDIFMTPRWTKSKGAVQEHTEALKIGLKIHYFPESDCETP